MKETATFADGVQGRDPDELGKCVGAQGSSAAASVAGYRGKQKNEREIGRTLGVFLCVGR